MVLRPSIHARRARLGVAGAIALLAAAAVAAAQDTAGKKKPPDVRGSRAALRDAWLASDAAVFGTYGGIDSTLGARYHIFEIADTWIGRPPRGRVLFKAPRGIRLVPGQSGLLLWWDRLAAATDAYLAETQERYGADFWANVGPDSITPYLLPFGAYSFAFDGDRLRLRGAGTFPIEIDRSALKKDLIDFEIEFLPERLYRSADAVCRATVRKMDLRPRREGDALLELRVVADFAVHEMYKGAALDSLRLEFGSYPRAPRFRAEETVILFLRRGPQGLYLAQGKRAVFHVVDGEVLEATQPLAAFVKSMRGR